jgi:hypothetical protein
MWRKIREVIVTFGDLYRVHERERRHGRAGAASGTGRD